MDSHPPTDGSFGSGEFAGVLRAFNKDAAVGRLDVAAERANCSLFLSGGRVDAIAADEERFKLGSWLAARGLLDSGAMAVALLKQPPDVPFGEFLVREGVLEELRLTRELQLRAAAMIGLLLFTPGSYRFSAGEEPAGGRSVAMELDTTELLLAAARSSDVDRLEEVAADTAARPRVDPIALEQARHALLSPQEAFLLSRIDGKTTAQGLQHLVPMSPPDLSRTLGALIIAGLAALERGPEAGAESKGAKAEDVVGPEVVAPPPEQAPDLATRSEVRHHRDVQRLALEIGSRDYYRRLGLSRGATQDQIHQRFKEMTRLYSTDGVSQSHLTALRGELERIQEALVEAYRTLTDPSQRARYDEFLRKEGSVPDGVSFKARDRQATARRQLVDANLKRAQELSRVGQVGEAIQLLEQAVRLDPQPETLLALAKLELRNPMWSQRALDRLRQALSTDARFTEAWLELAAFWGKRKKKDRQRECLRRVLEYDPENVEVQRALIDIGVV